MAFNKKGFTLLELMIVLIILGTIAGFIIPNLMDLTEFSLDSASRHIAVSMQSLYNKAAIKNVAYVAKFDFENKKYTIFKCEEVKAAETLTSEEKKKAEEAEKEKEKRLEKGELTEDDLDLKVQTSGDTDELNIGGDCAKDAESDFSSFTLPDNVSFKGIKTEFREGITEQGSEYLIFFPAGQMTKASIFLTDTNENSSTIEFHPLLGTFNIYDYLKDYDGTEEEK